MAGSDTATTVSGLVLRVGVVGEQVAVVKPTGGALVDVEVVDARLGSTAVEFVRCRPTPCDVPVAVRPWLSRMV